MRRGEGVVYSQLDQEPAVGSGALLILYEGRWALGGHALLAIPHQQLQNMV